MKFDPADLDVEGRLKKWAEATALCLSLLEASLRKDFPGLSDDQIRRRVIERLHAFRRVRSEGD